MNAPAIPTASVPSARFDSAWDAFQFAAQDLAAAQRRYFLAELAGHAYLVRKYKNEIAHAEALCAVAEANWRKTGPAA